MQRSWAAVAASQSRIVWSYDPLHAVNGARRQQREREWGCEGREVLLAAQAVCVRFGMGRCSLFN
jgi:hypothetical protein